MPKLVCPPKILCSSKYLCTYFRECGGCSLQHIDYQTQLENKRRTLAGHISIKPENIKDIKVFSGKEFGYRNRMDMVFYPGGLGLRKKNDWRRVVRIENCAIANERINTLIKEINQSFKETRAAANTEINARINVGIGAEIDAFDQIKKTGTFMYAVIRTAQNKTPNKTQEESAISFVLNQDSTRLAEAVSKIEDFAKKTTASNIIITYVPKESGVSISDDFFVVKGNGFLKQDCLGKEFIYPVQGFFQNNPEIAEKMQEYCNSLLKKYSTHCNTQNSMQKNTQNNIQNSRLIDLYAGVGVFGIINSDLFKEVTIVESDKNCIEAAKKNIKNNNASNVKAVQLNDSQLKKLGFPGQEDSLFVITDPPRSGMHSKAIEHLKFLRPKVIIYVSCNPEQLGKDILKFKSYRIRSIALFDLFPQTPHIEAVVELVLEH